MWSERNSSLLGYPVFMLHVRLKKYTLQKCLISHKPAIMVLQTNRSLIRNKKFVVLLNGSLTLQLFIYGLLGT